MDKINLFEHTLSLVNFGENMPPRVVAAARRVWAGAPPPPPKIMNDAS